MLWIGFLELLDNEIPVHYVPSEDIYQFCIKRKRKKDMSVFTN